MSFRFLVCVLEAAWVSPPTFASSRSQSKCSTWWNAVKSPVRIDSRRWRRETSCKRGWTGTSRESSAENRWLKNEKSLQQITFVIEMSHQIVSYDRDNSQLSFNSSRIMSTMLFCITWAARPCKNQRQMIYTSTLKIQKIQNKSENLHSVHCKVVSCT